MRVIRSDFETQLRKNGASRFTFYSGQAKQISPQLLLFQYERGRTYLPSRYHVIHASTGLVIADVEYGDVSTVKKTFERERWTLVGEDKITFRRLPKDRKDTFVFEMTCRIRYDIKEDENNG